MHLPHIYVCVAYVGRTPEASPVLVPSGRGHHENMCLEGTSHGEMRRPGRAPAQGWTRNQEHSAMVLALGVGQEVSGASGRAHAEDPAPASMFQAVAIVSSSQRLSSLAEDSAVVVVLGDDYRGDDRSRSPPLPIAYAS